MNWQIAAGDPRHLRLSQELQLHPLTAQLLINRGIVSVPDAVNFLTPKLATLPDPFLFPDMDRAVTRIAQAIERREKIAIYGDYDVDGVCSTALLARFFASLNVEPILFLPHRLRDGYGISASGVEKLLSQEVKLIVTVDNGTTAFDALARAQELGIDVIVTDHHEVSDTFPEAYAFLNPKRSDAPEIFSSLCGCGVALYLAMALRKKLCPEQHLLPLLELVALATIADCVPLLGINRVLVKKGLEVLRATTHPGLKALMHVSGIKTETFFPSSVSFGLAPRLNAAGRLDHASLSLKLLMSDAEQEAMSLALKLDELNRERQSLQESILQAAIAQVESASQTDALVVSGNDWHLGVIGIVAAKLAERFQKPTIVLSSWENKLKGSARSIGNLDLMHCLSQCADHLDQYGGHANAAGLSLSPDQLISFRERFSAVCRTELQHMSLASFSVDAEIQPHDINHKLIRELELFEPCGIGNPEPLFVSRGIAIRNPRIVGNDHLKFHAVKEKNSLEAIAFKFGSQPVNTDALHAIAFRPQLNTWNGQTSIQLKVKGFQSDV